MTEQRVEAEVEHVPPIWKCTKCGTVLLSEDVWPSDAGDEEFHNSAADGSVCSGDAERLDNIVIIENGYVIDMETGEVLAMLDRPKTGEPFRVHDEATAEWVMSKMQDEAIAIQALERRRDLFNKNVDAMIRDRQRRADWLDFKFAQELELWARENLPPRKKSVRTAFGVLAFRVGRNKLVVDDEAKAIAWADEHCPDAVSRDPKLYVSKLPKDAEPDGCHVELGQETFSIKVAD